MPQISNYKCDKCNLHLNTGWGSYVFAEDDNGKKIVCSHPCEESSAMKVLGIKGMFQKLNKKTAKDRVGVMRYCVCMDCASPLELEIEVDPWMEVDPINIYTDKSSFVRKPKDDRKCTECGSVNVRTVMEAVGQVCPKCKKGHIIEEDTGAMS